MIIPFDDLDQDDPVTDLPCKCQEYSTCSWSNHLVDQIHVLPKDNNARTDLINQFQTQICNLKNKHIWCCRNGEMASQSELKELSSHDNNDDNDNNKIPIATSSTTTRTTSTLTEKTSNTTTTTIKTTTTITTTTTMTTTITMTTTTMTTTTTTLAEVCQPNPCNNNGKCVEYLGKYVCDCFGTKYEGEYCEILRQACKKDEKDDYEVV